MERLLDLVILFSGIRAFPTSLLNQPLELRRQVGLAAEPPVGHAKKEKEI